MSFAWARPLLQLRPLHRLEMFNRFLQHGYVLAAIGGAWFTFVRNPETQKELVFGIALSAYFGILLLLFVSTVYTYRKKARFAEATKALHDAVHASRDAYKYLVWCADPRKDGVQYESRHFETLLIRCLTSAASAFSITTGVSCRTSIKVFGWDKASDKPYVTTLARDSASSGRARTDTHDDDVKHPLEGNTDFWLIYRRKRSYFFHGDLAKAEHYENTSLPTGWQVGQDWPLSYKSTIVLPIRYVYTRHDVEGLREDGLARDPHLSNQDLYGFFTVDCGPRNAFDERYDVELGNVVADAFVSMLETYSRVREALKPASPSGNSLVPAG